MRYPSGITDREWVELAPLPPPEGGAIWPRAHELRLVLDAVFYVLRSGCAWQMLPAPFPP
jgi:putative transposase